LENLTIADFEGLEFDISGDDFFERIDGYGIALKSLNGHPVRIPGYGSNNGYYSCDLELVLKDASALFLFPYHHLLQPTWHLLVLEC
jgi:hypothetical protein